MRRNSNSNDVDLALKWVKGLTEDMGALEKLVSIPSPEDIRKLFLIDASTTLEESAELMKKHKEFYNLMCQAREFDKSAYTETVNDLDAISMLQIWARNKQIFSFDADFLAELLNTDTPIFEKDSWDYLPYNPFYVDLSDSEELSQKIGKGFFLYIEKTGNDTFLPEMQNSYYVHLCRVTDEMYFCDMFSRKNTSGTVEINKDATVVVPTMAMDKKHGEMFSIEDIKTGEATLSSGLYDLLVMQILTYLSSLEPDIKENSITKNTYRKPKTDSKPKNKFSEVQKWNVGESFGVSYRKWEKEHSASHGGHGGGSGASGIKKRPHSRKAHWSHYWYGSGDNKVRRPKWISATFVNASDTEVKVTVNTVSK